MYNTWQTEGLLYIYNRISPIYLDTIGQIATGQLLSFFIYLIIRIISAILCVNIAKGLNRNQTGWGIFGFFLPPIALIIISVINNKEIAVKDHNELETIIHEDIGNTTSKGYEKIWISYPIKQGKLDVEIFKINKFPNKDDSVVLNGEPAPDGRYKIGLFDVIKVKDSKVIRE